MSAIWNDISIDLGVMKTRGGFVYGFLLNTILSPTYTTKTYSFQKYPSILLKNIPDRYHVLLNQDPRSTVLIYAFP